MLDTENVQKTNFKNVESCYRSASVWTWSEVESERLEFFEKFQTAPKFGFKFTRSVVASCSSNICPSEGQYRKWVF